jgi:hypothetical protein
MNGRNQEKRELSAQRYMKREKADQSAKRYRQEREKVWTG